ncbi:hypothetical protein [Citricoccus alkalitolerans]|uniref:Uncharacterized protein n=1 Tax=Citricoccus alkalitolerans TaxID=246603 RepID=A0ABV8Y116_9MICC
MTDMLTRFRTVPKAGTTLDTPLIGWRYEWTDGQRLWNYSDDTARAALCYRRPSGINRPSRNHQAPHHRCVCGFRVVGDLDVLHTYMARRARFTEVVGLDRERPEGATGLVITKVEVTGYVTPAVPNRQVDPPFTVRADHLRLLKVYAPDWMDRDRIARANPEVPIKPLGELPRGFPGLKSGPLPEPELSISQHGDEIRIVLGLGPAIVPTALLQDPDVAWAVHGVANPGRSIDADVNTVIDRIVNVVRPDIAFKADQEAAAFGIAWTLDMMANSAESK